MHLDKNVSFILLCSLHCNHLPIGFVQTSDDIAVTYSYREGCEIGVMGAMEPKAALRCSVLWTALTPRV
jgi:hypothetical protein